MRLNRLFSMGKTPMIGIRRQASDALSHTLENACFQGPVSAKRKPSNASSAIHFQRYACDELGFIGGEVQSRVRYVLRCRKPSQWDRCQELLPVRGRVLHAHEIGQQT